MFLNSGRTYPKTMATFRVKQQVVRAPRISAAPVVKTLFWKKFARPAAVVLAVMLSLNFLMGAMVNSTVAKKEAVADVRHDLVDDNIALRAEKAGLLADNTIWSMAGERLSLVQPKGHRYTFSR